MAFIRLLRGYLLRRCSPCQLSKYSCKGLQGEQEAWAVLLAYGGEWRPDAERRLMARRPYLPGMIHLVFTERRSSAHWAVQRTCHLLRQCLQAPHRVDIIICYWMVVEACLALDPKLLGIGKTWLKSANPDFSSASSWGFLAHMCGELAGVRRGQILTCTCCPALAPALAQAVLYNQLEMQVWKRRGLTVYLRVELC